MERSYTGLAEDTLQGGEYAYTGKSNGWQYFEFQWVWVMLVKKDQSDFGESVLIRFRFLSDGNETSKEGWMIDDMVFRGYIASGNINDYGLNNSIAYPNPAGDMVYFKMEEDYPEDRSVCVFNYLGQKLRSENMENMQMNLSGLPGGVYIYEICSQDRIISRGKFTKK